MSNTKFTPGEWQWVNGKTDELWNGADLVIAYPSLRTKERFKGRDYSLPKFIIDAAEGLEYMDEEKAANAHLIASAPDLYEQLQEALEILEGIFQSHNVINASMYLEEDDLISIKSALSKARGE